MEPENEEEYLSLSRAADILGVSTKTIRNWDDRGKIRTVRTPGNHRRIPVSEVTRLLQEERLRPGEILAELQQESEAYMGQANATEAGATITPSEYRAHLKLFGLEDVEALRAEKTELLLTPELNIEGELNRDELTNFTRLLIHKIEDILNDRLNDEEYISFRNMVANIHHRASSKEATVEVKNKTVRPGRASGITPGIPIKSPLGGNPSLGFLED